MRIAVIDDQPADRETIAALVMCWAKARNTAVTAIPFPSAESFLFAYSEDRDFDILLLASLSPPISSWRARATRWTRFIISSSLCRRKSSPPY